MTEKRRIYVAGFPHEVGGAGPEAFHASLVWQKFGNCDVHWIPTWGGPGDPRAVGPVEAAGQFIHRGITARSLRKVPGLENQTVVMFCNDIAAGASAKFRELHCRLVAVPCMTYWLGHYRRNQWDAIVCQSEFQRDLLKLPDAKIIRGAFAFWEPAATCEPRPHVPGNPFVIGRLARKTPKKWHPELWKWWGQIPNVRGMAMGIGESTKRTVGKPPPWATALEEGAMRPLEFHRQLHAYINMNWQDRENWPRVGLEAMAYGVPLVAENKWGWREMIISGESGFLYDCFSDMVDFAKQLERDEDFRLRIVAAGRKRLEQIADPEPIWRAWEAVLWA